jgi:hypothetical protein
MPTGAATKSHGFEWRTLLGPTHNWPMRTAELNTTTEQRSSMECCELCGGPIGDGRSFTTNSAGQRAMHITCLGDQEPTCMERRRIWEHLLQTFVRG